jgi:hypothetical protein
MIYRAIQLSIVIQMALSKELWWPSGARLFPLVPAFDVLDGISGWISGLLSSLLALSVIAMVSGFWSKRKHAITGIVLMSLLGIIDLNRLQVWVWMWFLFWILDIWGGGSKHGYRWVLAGIYFWGGLNKLNPWFLDNFDWFCAAFEWSSPFVGNKLAAGLAAIFELVLGMFLLWHSSRRWAIWGVFLIHCYILLVIGPIGYNWNQVVWPWNIAMMGLVWHFFRELGEEKKPICYFIVLVAILVWVMPVLNFFGWWPESFSWKMYSNTQREAGIVSAVGRPCLVLAPYWDRYSVEDRYLQIDDWSYAELKVPAFNSIRTFEKVLVYTRDCSDAPSDRIQLDIYTVNRWKR